MTVSACRNVCGVYLCGCECRRTKVGLSPDLWSGLSRQAQRAQPCDPLFHYNTNFFLDSSFSAFHTHTHTHTLHAHSWLTLEISSTKWWLRRKKPGGLPSPWHPPPTVLSQMLEAIRVTPSLHEDLQVEVMKVRMRMYEHAALKS